MNTGDRAVQQEATRRKQQRIVQVREQSKEIAARLRKRVSQERERQKEDVEKLKIDELRKWREGRFKEQQQQYDHIIASTLDANEEARRETEANFLYKQRKDEMDLMAAQRGRAALRKELIDRAKPVKKSKSRSREVQTDPIECLPGPAPTHIHHEAAAASAVHVCLPPESSNRDHDHDHVPMPEPVISDRSVDILEKSKRFVEDATKRLEEISEKVAKCHYEMHVSGDAESAIDTPEPLPPREVAKKKTQSITSVRTNNTTRLRCSLNAQPATTKPKIKPRPKKVIPSAPERVVEPSETKGSVVCYDHPNRFTKTYDIPKNIIVRNAQNNDEDDAVANAYNETLSQIEEDSVGRARSRDLKRKEAVRELEAMEKSQVRRDYEMLAKTLEEVRKERSSSPNTYSYQSVQGSVHRASSANNIPVEVENEILHVPIRISCPKVTDKGKLNVGHPTDRDDFSGSDSAQTIILDQLMKAASTSSEDIPVTTGRSRDTLSQRDGRLLVVTDKNGPKVRLVKGNGGTEPVKIIIQVENVKGQDSNRDEMALDLPHRPRIHSLVNESLSTNYMSPPSEMETHLDKFLKPNRRKIVNKKPIAVKKNPNLKELITRLLEMPQSDVEKLTDHDVSDIPTPSNSVINVRSNCPDSFYGEEKLNSVSRIIEDNYSILEEVDQLIAKNRPSQPRPRELATQESINNATSKSSQSTESILQRYATMSQNYNDRIQSLSKMIRVIRAEKENLMMDNGISNVTTSERDTSTKYKDFGKVPSTSGSDLSNDSGELIGVPKKKSATAGEYPKLHSNQVIGHSRDSGISMSRPVTSTDIRDSEERHFEPMLKDIPKKKPLEMNKVPEVDKKRPPNSITRYSPEAIQAAGHDLSTIIEVDTGGTAHVGGTMHDSLPGDLKKFPTIEEFVNQHGNNTSVMSEADRAEIVPVKPFVSFKQFVNKDNSGTAPANETTANEVDLSEIADELRRRSLLQGDESHDNDNDEKKYLRTLSKELEDMIKRINSEGLKEPNATGISMTSCKTDAGEPAADQSSIGQLLDQIRINKFPSRAEFNEQNQSTHYHSAEVLKSFLNGTLQAEENGVGPSSATKSTIPNVEEKQRFETSTESTGSDAKKRSSDSLRSQTLNLSDDLMNALENNLSEMGLKWAVNMLKRSHQQISSRCSSSEENLQRDQIPFESKTISLLTDFEKSLIIESLIKARKSGNSSSNGSLSSSSNLERRLLNGTLSDDGRCLRTSTPVNSNVLSSISTSTVVDRDKTPVVDMSSCLFSGESKLSSVKGEAMPHLQTQLNVPELRLDTRKYTGDSHHSTVSTEYSVNEHNKRKMTRKLSNK